MIFLLYEDDGPLGICGQSMSITSSWRKLIRVENEDEAYHLIRLSADSVGLCKKLSFCGVNGSECRKNARITGVFGDNEDFYNNILDYRGKIGKFDYESYNYRWR